MREDDVVWKRWPDVDRVFELALDAPEADREPLVRRLCDGDAELRETVLDLLARSQSDDARLSSPGPELVETALGPGDRERPGSLAPGDIVGRYRVVGELGRGGMATVYEAERSDGAYRQTVALKVLRRGLDTDRIVDRFLAERQILSDFAHPNVARLLDGGATDDGRPYLVVEKVDGDPLTRWASGLGLATTRRLELFLQVTEAVKEAHRRLVVHRDLKPTNILVDGSGCVKLLDFGIAKLLGDADGDGDGDLTGLGPYPLTRRYASPEQLRGEAVTTSSDIYQLGIILFELLARRHPFDDDSASPAAQAPLPSRACAGDALAEVRALARELRGDLDTIVCKALEPDPEERYRAVEDLAEDIRRHLEGQPIRASPASRPLRVRKWFRRNPWAPPATAVLVLVAAAYVGTVTVTARRLERERNQAQAQAVRAERIKGFLLELFQSADPFQAAVPLPSDEVSVVGGLEGAGSRIRSELEDDPEMQVELLAAFASIFANLDREQDGRPLVEQALAIRERHGLTEPPAVATDLVLLARLLPPDSARVVLRSAVELLRGSVPANDVRLARALSALFLHENTHFAGREPALGEEALAILDGAGPAYRRETAGVLIALSGLHSHVGQFDAAERTAREALRLYEEDAGRLHPTTALARINLARVLDHRQRFSESIPLYEESIPVLDELLGPEHDETLSARNDLAATYQLAGRLEEAIVVHREVLAIRRAQTENDLHTEVANSTQNLAAALKELGRWEEADSLARRAYDIYAQTVPAGHYILAFPLLTRTEILLKSGDPLRAEGTAREALLILQGSLPSTHYAIGVARCRLGAALLERGMAPEASPHVRAALGLLEGDERTPPAYMRECVEVGRRLAGIAPTT
jgi:serine/threonine-protein kinase